MELTFVLKQMSPKENYNLKTLHSFLKKGGESEGEDGGEILIKNLICVV